MTKARFLSFAFLLGLVARATAYDNVTTHRFLSILAGERSVLGLPEAVHSSLGLKVNTFQNGEGQYRSITALLADGAEFEDGDLRDAPDWRPLTHFYNPRTTWGLFNAFAPSPNWALEDR